MSEEGLPPNRPAFNLGVEIGRILAPAAIPMAVRRRRRGEGHARADGHETGSEEPAWTPQRRLRARGHLGPPSGRSPPVTPPAASMSSFPGASSRRRADTLRALTRRLRSTRPRAGAPNTPAARKAGASTSTRTATSRAGPSPTRRAAAGLRARALHGALRRRARLVPARPRRRGGDDHAPGPRRRRRRHARRVTPAGARGPGRGGPSRAGLSPPRPADRRGWSSRRWREGSRAPARPPRRSSGAAPGRRPAGPRRAPAPGAAC